METDASPSSGRVRFGDFEVDVSSRELLRSGQRVRLQEKSFLLLHELLKSPGRVVTREALAAALWPKEHFVDAEHGLNTAVRRLREALGDSAEAPRFVETLPKLGYRFVAAIEAPSEPTLRPSSVEAPPARRVRALPVIGAAVLLLALGALLVGRARDPRPRGRSSSDAAEELLARSRYLRNHKRFAEAKSFVEETLKLDPKNGQALAGLSLNLFGEGKDEQAREAARRALELDPDAWEAYRTLGVLARGAGDMAGAERYLRRSVEIRPDDSKSRNRLARHLLECGRMDDAKAQMLESRRLAPDDPDVQNIWMEYALRTGDYESAIRQGEIWTAIWEKQIEETTRDRFTVSKSVRDMLGLAYVGARRHEDAIRQFRTNDPDDQLRVALAIGHAGRTAEARAILDAHDLRTADPGLAGAIAMSAVVIGDFDRAFRALDRQLAGRWYPGWLECVLFHAIRRDPRWAAFTARLDREFFRGEQRSLFPAWMAFLQHWPRPAKAARARRA